MRSHIYCFTDIEDFVTHSNISEINRGRTFVRFSVACGTPLRASVSNVLAEVRQHFSRKPDDSDSPNTC